MYLQPSPKPEIVEKVVEKEIEKEVVKLVEGKTKIVEKIVTKDGTTTERTIDNTTTSVEKEEARVVIKETTKLTPVQYKFGLGLTAKIDYNNLFKVPISTYGVEYTHYVKDVGLSVTAYTDRSVTLGIKYNFR